MAHWVSIEDLLDLVHAALDQSVVVDMVLCASDGTWLLDAYTMASLAGRREFTASPLTNIGLMLSHASRRVSDRRLLKNLSGNPLVSSLAFKQ